MAIRWLGWLIVALFLVNGTSGQLHRFEEESDEDISIKMPSYLEKRMIASQSHNAIYTEKDVGKPLLLTPMIDSNKIEVARKASKVQHKELNNIAPSYTGFFTVNKEFDSNIFFWHIPAKNKPEKAPLVLWLQGGPGGSSMFGLFNELGPYIVNSNGNVGQRNVSWSDSYNLLYIDQPAGTGFSYTKNIKGFPTNEDEVADDLYKTLVQFFTLFPHLLQNDFYVSGESYAGKYVPALSFKIHNMNKKGHKPKIPLKGLAVGDGLSDPIHQINYGEFLFEIGLVDETLRDSLIEMANKTKQLIKDGKFLQAHNMLNSMLFVYENNTGLNNPYNYLLKEQPEALSYYTSFLKKPDVRKGIHVGNVPFDDLSRQVYKALAADFCKSIVPKLETLLDNDYKVMYYNGQVDVIIPHTGSELLIANLNWKGKSNYKGAKRFIWRVDDKVAGYAREVLNFRQVMVRNAGHMVPFDQPTWAFDMISRFIHGQSFSDTPSTNGENLGQPFSRATFLTIFVANLLVNFGF